MYYKQRTRSVAAAAPSFDPTDLDLELWLDATDGATITESAGSVTQWDDKSPNAATYTAGGTPNLNSGKIELRSGDYFTSTDLLTATEGDVVIVVRLNSSGVNQYFYCIGDTSTTSTFTLFQMVDSTNAIRMRDLATVNGTLDTNTAFTDTVNPYVINYTYPGITNINDVDVYVDNSLETCTKSGTTNWLNTAGAAALDTAGIGRLTRSSAVNAADYDIYELIITGTELTTGERTDLYNYLVTKHSL